MGADGLQDVRIQVSGLSTKLTLKAIRIEGPKRHRLGIRDQPQAPPQCRARPGRQGPDPRRRILPAARDMAGQRLKLTVCYENDRSAVTTVLAGPCDPRLRMPQSPLPKLVRAGRHGHVAGPRRRKPVHAGRRPRRDRGSAGLASIVGAVLSDSMRGCWIYRQNDRVTLAARSGGGAAHDQAARRSEVGRSLLPPYRDESKGTLTLRLIAADGRSSVVRFAGGSCDLAKRCRRAGSRRAWRPSRATTFQALSTATERSSFRRGLPAEPPARAQPAGDLDVGRRGDAPLRPGCRRPPWTTAIKVHCGNTTLDGFAVRFEGPVRWNNEVSWGPAVIGMTDNLDQGHDDPKLNVAFTHLDLEIPPVARTAAGSKPCA